MRTKERLWEEVPRAGMEAPGAGPGCLGTATQGDVEKQAGALLTIWDRIFREMEHHGKVLSKIRFRIVLLSVANWSWHICRGWVFQETKNEGTF